MTIKRIDLICKKIIDTGEQKYYVMEDIVSKKNYLLPFEYYHKYHFQAGQKISATIDKINCSGEIFIEPDHPYYETGKCYWFNLISMKKNEKSIELIVKDILENQLSLCFTEIPTIHNNQVFLCVKGIRKGLPILCLKPEDTLIYQKGQWYYLQIENIEKNNPDSYLILRDEEGRHFRLPLQNYHHYPFKVNDTIRCFVSDITPDGKIHWEPEHPSYPLNTTLQLKLHSKEIKYLSEQQKKHPSYVLVNERNDKFYLPIALIDQSTNLNSWEWYRVYRYRKGKIIVRPIQKDE
ncbi:MAG: hypothetical protein N2Z72_08715 [Bacteroidales bacterium]|nr:hypothetical protein [Bacteroidales bacterium]